MKRALNIGFWIVFCVGLMFTLGFVGEKQSSRKIGKQHVQIAVVHHGQNQFLNEEILKNRIAYYFGYDIDSVQLDRIDLNALEEFLHRQDEVKNVQVFKSVDGHIFLEVTERNPIVRLIHSNGQSNYLDVHGNYMPLSTDYTAHVLVVSGAFNESSFKKNVFSIKVNPVKSELMISDDIYDMASFISQSEFWNAQIQQIEVDENREFVLIPRVGDHRIIFGSSENMKRKFKKLKVFYKEGLNNTGWNTFKSINLKFRNQVVCK